MKKHITCAVALGLMLIGSAAYAQTPQKPQRPGPAQRLNIGPRIRDGVKSGTLTKPELQQLRQRLAQIRKDAKAMRADGNLGPGERRKLRGEWRMVSRALFRLKHNKRHGK